MAKWSKTLDYESELEILSVTVAVFISTIDLVLYRLSPLFCLIRSSHRSRFESPVLVVDFINLFLPSCSVKGFIGYQMQFERQNVQFESSVIGPSFLSKPMSANIKRFGGHPSKGTQPLYIGYSPHGGDDAVPIQWTTYCGGFTVSARPWPPSAVYRSCSDLLPITRPPPVNDSYDPCEYVGALQATYNGPRSTQRLPSSDGLILKEIFSSRGRSSDVLITASSFIYPPFL
ncbi:hypothetical protein J6590_009100 [Homalodisca vitripennis]|nr:hypothetical protein J6590_009100 [Homalodisca vitripennis]